MELDWVYSLRAHENVGWSAIPADVMIMFSIALQDADVLRNWFIIKVLKYYFNDSINKIPKNIRAVVYSIRNIDVEKYY